MTWDMEPDIAARARRNGGKAERTRELLLNAAVAVAARDGLMALSFESIGRRAAMSPSGVAHRLGTLEKARAAVLEEVERRLKEGVLARTQGSGAPRIWNACVEFLAAYEAVPLFTDVFSAVERRRAHEASLTARARIPRRRARLAEPFGLRSPLVPR